MVATMTDHRSRKILRSKDDIKEYLGGISDHLFKKFIEAGMPARYEDGRWMAHADNLDDFFKLYTRVSMKNKMSLLQEENQI